jgi:hypothetical protein
MFAVPFDEIAPIVGRTPTAARKLASRARDRVQGVDPSAAATDLARRQAVVEAFLAASRGGDFQALLAVLDPDVVLRADAAPDQTFGATAVATRIRDRARGLRLALVDGAIALVGAPQGDPVVVFWFDVANGLVIGIDVETDPTAVAARAITLLD